MGVVIDSAPLAMTSPDLASDQSQWVVSLVHVHGSYGYEIVAGDL